MDEEKEIRTLALFAAIYFNKSLDIEDQEILNTANQFVKYIKGESE